jgi:hypothetical protein
MRSFRNPPWFTWFVVRAGAVAALVMPAVVMPPGAFPAAPTATALYLDRTVSIERTLDDPTDLWVLPEVLTELTGFVLKPEGACLDELCIPVDQGPGSEVVLRRGEETWFSLTGFARRVGQSFVADHEQRVWSFAPVPAVRSSFVDQAYAPDFVLPDRQGNPVRLSDFRGKKVLLVTWASW